jgi:hypothetical protein
MYASFHYIGCGRCGALIGVQAIDEEGKMHVIVDNTDQHEYWHDSDDITGEPNRAGDGAQG